MKKSYVSHVDFSEINTVSTDELTKETALARLTEVGAITAKGRPDVNYLNALSGKVSAPFCGKLQRRLSRRRDGVTGVYSLLQRMYGDKEYTAMYLYIAIMYGYLEWQVPEILSLLPASPEALKVFMGEFMADFEEFLRDMTAETDAAETANSESAPAGDDSE